MFRQSNSILWRLTLSQLVVIVLVTLLMADGIWIVIHSSERYIRRLNIGYEVQNSLVYDENGAVALDSILFNTDFLFECAEPLNFLGTNMRISSGPTAIAACEPEHRSIVVPTNGDFPITYRGLHAIAIYDQQGQFVSGLTDEEPDLQIDLDAMLNWALEESLNRPNFSMIAGNTVIFGPSSNPSSLEDTDTGRSTFVVPIFNGVKQETVGAVVFQFNLRAISYLPLLMAQLGFRVILIGLVVGGIGSFLIASRMKKRVEALQDAAEAWGEGNFSIKIDDRSTDEIGQLGEDLNWMSDQLEELVETRSMLSGVETRQQLARDLHDAAKQQLFAAGLQLEAVGAMLEKEPERARTHLQHASALTDQAQEELSIVIQALRPIQLQEKGLFEAAREWLNRFEKQQGIRVRFESQGDPPVSTEVETALFRVLQEALSNVAKHSEAPEVAVSLYGSDRELSLTVQDNGIGFDPNRSTDGFGLQSMYERIERLGGSFELVSRPGEGAKLVFLIENG